MSRKSVVRVSAKEALEALPDLLRYGEPWAALRTLQLASSGANSAHEHDVVLSAVRLVPFDAFDSPAWWCLLARARCMTRDWAGTLEACAEARLHFEALALADALVFEAFAWLRLGNTRDALALLERIEVGVSEDMLGLLWRVRAESLAQLKRVGWEEAFQMAFLRLQGRALGTCLIEYGVVLDAAGDALAAQRAWFSALPHFGNDPMYRAWVQHALGNSFLRLGRAEAETHFMAAEQCCRDAKAKSLRSRVWCGLAASRRVLGEWARAEAGYLKALRLAEEDDDRLEALRGLGYTRRLAGLPNMAFEPLGVAVNGGLHGALLDVVGAFLQLEDVVGAQGALQDFFGRVGEKTGDEEAQRLLVVQAELQRQLGQADQALLVLKGLNVNSVLAKEEALCFPLLFRLASSMGLASPASAVVGAVTRVEVFALGTLRVLVNGRVVPLKPTGKAGELLVYMVLAGGACGLDVLLAALYPQLSADATARRGKSKNIWTLVNGLRDALGWQDCVRNVGGAYRLDETASWWCDALEARKNGAGLDKLLDGVYSEWVLESRHVSRDPLGIN